VAAGVLVGLQGAGALVGSIWLLVGALTAGNSSGSSVQGVNGYAEAGFFFVVAVAVLGVAAGLVTGHRWSRTPCAVLEVLLLAMSGYLVSSPGLTGYGLAVIAICIVTLVLLFTRRGRAWAVTDPD
jgi:hypothetical protein